MTGSSPRRLARPRKCLRHRPLAAGPVGCGGGRPGDAAGSRAWFVPGKAHKVPPVSATLGSVPLWMECPPVDDV